MRRLFTLTLILCCCALAALAQPEIVPAPPANGGFDAAMLMKQTNEAIAEMAKQMLTAKRAEKLTDEGLIVTPFIVNVPQQDDWIAFVVVWVQEMMTTAMIQQDDAGHFEVVDRLKIEMAMKELKLDANALKDPKVWPELGKATGAKYMVTGSIILIPMAEKPLTLAFSLTSRVVSVDTGKAVSAGSATFIFKNGDKPAEAK